jgi:hypothetical protein
MERRCVVLLIPLFGSLAAILYVTLPALARDLEGRYVNSPLKPWFERSRRFGTSYAERSDVGPSWQ